MEERPVENVCEESLFNNLFKKYSKDLHDFLYYKYGSDNNPKDLVQEAFIKLWDNCHKVSLEKARSCVFKVGHKQIVNQQSKKKKLVNNAQQKPRQHTSESPEYLMEESEYMQRLQSALESLSEDQRVTFLMNRIEGKKHQEIAEILGISRKAVEKRIYTALDKLRKQIGDI